MSTEPVPNRAEPSGTWGTVQQASAELGISERAVIKRISNGALEAIREGKQWRVRLADTPAPSEPGSEPKAASSEPDSELAEPSAEPVPNDKDVLIEELKADVEFLRSLLRQRDIAESEFRRLLLSRDMEIARLQQENRLLLIAPPVEGPSDEQTTPELYSDNVQKAASMPSDDTQDVVGSTGTSFTDAPKVIERQESGNPVQSGQKAPQTTRRWWEVWKRGKE